MRNADNRLPECLHNDGVGCYTDRLNGHCCRCGWNPVVEKKRKEKLDTVPATGKRRGR